MIRNQVETHVNDDTLERYAMWSLQSPESERLEEHLLICAECRDLLQSTNEYVAAMKEAAAKLRESGTGE
jgi:anti-sigma factor ChrR (cupin superfamily)